MKRLLRIFICFALVFVSCFAMVGCGKDKTPEPSENWTELQIGNSNISSYFDLEGYLAYSFNNASGNMAGLWADNYYAMGSGSTYLEDPLLSTPGYNLSNTKTFQLSDFTTVNEVLKTDGLKWRVIILKAKEDLIVDWFNIRAYLCNSISVENYGCVDLEFSVKETSKTGLTNIKTYKNSKGLPNQQLGLGIYNELSTDDYYSEIVLFREYYGNEIYEWNRRDVKVLKDQLFCIEFTGIEQITPTYSGFTNFSEIELQTKLNFAIDSISMTIKTKN